MESFKPEALPQEEDAVHVEVESGESNEAVEILNERMEVLEGLLEEFDSLLGPALNKYEGLSKISFAENNDQIQRKAFSELLDALSKFELHTKAMFDLFESKEGGDGLNHIYSTILDFKAAIIDAPDMRQSREAQIESFGGKEQIPAGTPSFEDTMQKLQILKGEFLGMKISLKFLKPEKVTK